MLFALFVQPHTQVKRWLTVVSVKITTCGWEVCVDLAILFALYLFSTAVPPLPRQGLISKGENVVLFTLYSSGGHNDDVYAGYSSVLMATPCTNSLGERDDGLMMRERKVGFIENTATRHRRGG